MNCRPSSLPEPHCTFEVSLASTRVDNRDLDHVIVKDVQAGQVNRVLSGPIRFYASRAIRPALLGETLRRDLRNQRLRHHVIVIVRCDLFLEFSSHDYGVPSVIFHGWCRCTCTYKQLKQDRTRECAQSITPVVTVLAQPIPQSLDVFTSKF